MRAFTGLAAASALMMASAPVFAGSLEEPVTEPVVVAPAPAYSSLWSGAYGGAQIGYGDLEQDNGASLDDDGVIGGLHAGWQNNYERFVYGLEADVNATDISLGNQDLNSLSHIKAKAGYDLGRSLVYATAGGAHADFDGSGDDWGYAAGLGYDYMVTDNVSVGAEALYHWFDDYDGAGTDLEGTTVAAKVAFHF